MARMTRCLISLAAAALLGTFSPVFADEPPMPDHSYARCSVQKEFCLQANPVSRKIHVFRNRKGRILARDLVWIVPAYAQNASPSPDGQSVAALQTCLVEDTEIAAAQPVLQIWAKNGRNFRFTYRQLLGKTPLASLPATASHRLFCQTYGFMPDGLFMIETVFRGKIYIDPQNGKEVLP